MDANMKLSNPKDLIGASKLPLHLWPETATAYGCLGLLDGALKYGRGNFRAVGVRASIYYDAARRHLNAWFEGQDQDPDSGLPHLAHALACLAILVDATEAGKLNDDRQYPGGYLETVKRLTPEVERLKRLRAEAEPEQHYTIQQTARPNQNSLTQRINEIKRSIEEQFRQQSQPYMVIPKSQIPCNGCKGFTTCPDGACDFSCAQRAKSAYADTELHELAHNRLAERLDYAHEDEEGDPNYWGV